MPVNPELDDIKTGLQSSFGNTLTVEEAVTNLDSSQAMLQEIMSMGNRIEAILDILAVLPTVSLREQEYEFAVENVCNFRPNADEPFEDFLARRRATLLKILQDAGLR